MKKTLILAAAAALVLASCNNGGEKNTAAPSKTGSAEASGSVKIAYVDMDSLQNNYDFFKEAKAEMEKKSKTAQSTLQQKGQALQSAAAKFQQDIQNNKYTQQQAQNVQASLQKQQADVAALEQRLGTELQEQQASYAKAMQDSLDNFLKVYNKDKKYAFILNKAVMLQADEAYDITKEVIEGMNKAYKKK